MKQQIRQIDLLKLVLLLSMGLMLALAGASAVYAGGGNNNNSNDSNDSPPDSCTNCGSPTSVGLQGTVQTVGDNGSQITNINGDGVRMVDHNGDGVFSGNDISYISGGDDNNNTSYTPKPTAACPALARYNECISWGGWDRMGEMYRSCGRRAPTCTTPVQSTPSCTADPDLVTGAISVSGTPTSLEPGIPYTVSATITNNSCRATSHNAISQSPFAATLGMFPVRLQIDLNNDGTINETRRVDNRGPLDGNANVAVSFSNVTLPAGTHRLFIYTDVPGDIDSANGCAGAAGCILEAPVDNNEQTLLVTVAEPSVTLGSFLIPNSSSGNEQSRPSNSFSTDNRDISGFTGDVGLYWEGNQVQPNTCVTTGPDFQADSSSQNYSALAQGYSNNDATIDEPAIDTSTSFSIECTTVSGGTVRDTILLSNTGTVIDPIFVSAQFNDTSVISLNANESITDASFTLRNEGDREAIDTSYTLTIGGTVLDSGDGFTLPARDTLSQTASFNWTPSTAGGYTLRVCAQHPEDVRGTDARCDTRAVQVSTAPACSNGVNDDPTEDTDIDAADPGCHTDGDPNGPGDPNTTGNPNDPNCPSATCSYDPNRNSEANPLPPLDPPFISVSQNPVRQGDEVTLSWDPIDSSRRACTLSANVPGSPDANVAGSIVLTANRTAEYRITCDDGQSTPVRLQVIPILFET